MVIRLFSRFCPDLDSILSPLLSSISGEANQGAQFVDALVPEGHDVARYCQAFRLYAVHHTF